MLELFGEVGGRVGGVGGGLPYPAAALAAAVVHPEDQLGLEQFGGAQDDPVDAERTEVPCPGACFGCGALDGAWVVPSIVRPQSLPFPGDKGSLSLVPFGAGTPFSLPRKSSFPRPAACRLPSAVCRADGTARRTRRDLMTATGRRRGILRPLAGLLFPPETGDAGPGRTGPGVAEPGGSESGGTGPGVAQSPHGVLPPLLIVLTFVSGLVDAVSYLGLGHVFVANMTGNVVFLGFAIAGDRSLSAPDSLLALGAFLAGATAAGRLRRGAGAAGMFAPLVAVQTVLVGGALALTAVGGGPAGAIALLALGMGLQNAVVHRLAIPDLTTTVVTRALTGLAADPWGPAPLRRLVTVMALLLGALTGGLLVLRHGSVWALATAVGLLAWVVLASLRADNGPLP